MFSTIKPRTVVKMVAQTAYHVACVSASTAAIDAAFDPQTESAEDKVEMAGFAVGSLIWWRTGGLVNVAVDKVADWRLARKNPETPEVPVQPEI